VVAVVFQNDFYLEMHQNNFFLKLFLTSAHQNNLKIPKKINLKQIKNFQFFSKVFLKCQNKRGIFSSKCYFERDNTYNYICIRIWDNISKHLCKENIEKILEMKTG